MKLFFVSDVCTFLPPVIVVDIVAVWWNPPCWIVGLNDALAHVEFFTALATK